MQLIHAPAFCGGSLRYSSLGRRFLGQGATLARSKSSWVCPLGVSLKEDGLNNLIYIQLVLFMYIFIICIYLYLCMCFHTFIF